MPGSRIQAAVRHHLQISIDQYRPSHGRNDSSPVSTASPTSSTRASISTSRASVSTVSTSSTRYSPNTPSTASSVGGSDWILFSVLCLHDFKSNDPDQLSFRKNEILYIVTLEATGWWAAVRQNGTQVGWIPSAFVAELDGTEEDKLQKVRFDLRVYEYDAERLYNSVPVSQIPHIYPDPLQSPSAETPDDEWVPEGPEVSSVPGAPVWRQSICSFIACFSLQVPSAQLVTPTDIIPRGDLQNGTESGELESCFPMGEVDSLSPSSARFRVPPSPSTPIPQPPTTTTAPLLIHKPGPSAPAPVRSSSTSALSSGLPRRAIIRSHSDTASSTLNGRNLRRRPVLVDDSVSLSSLSTLMETNNLSEVEILTSPQMSDSFSAFSRATGKTSEEKLELCAHDDDDAMNFSNAKLAQSHLPMYLRPSYNSDTLKVDPEGRVKAGTLPALVERLTVNPPGGRRLR
jgi:son of sevenless